MSDHDADPIDNHYAQAEAVLDDAAARAARRARVLGAVADAGQPQASSPAPSTRRVLWGHGRWLAAASVAGFSLLVGLRYYHPPSIPTEPPTTPPTAAAGPPAVSAPAAVAPTSVTPPAPASKIRVSPERTTGPPPPGPAAETQSARDALAIQAPAPAAPAAPRTEPAPTAFAAAPSAEVGESVVVTAERRAQSVAPAALAARPSKAAQDSAQAKPAGQAASLQAAAAAGRVSELTALLNRGAGIDAPDDQGETALMKAVRANQSAAAALLRRRGASLEVKNHAGQSARDIAAQIGDPALNRALGLPQ